MAIDTGITNDLDVERDYEAHAKQRSGTRTMVLNMGPQHPSTHGVLRLLLELDGETILKAAPDIGYLHTGIEKEFEAKTYQQSVTLTDRIDYLAPLSNNLVYCLAAEKLLGLEIPPATIDENLSRLGCRKISATAALSPIVASWPMYL